MLPSLPSEPTRQISPVLGVVVALGVQQDEGAADGACGGVLDGGGELLVLVLVLRIMLLK